jgi:hypothetical protein
VPFAAAVPEIIAGAVYRGSGPGSRRKGGERHGGGFDSRKSYGSMEIWVSTA